MRLVLFVVAMVVALGLGAAAALLKPVEGPPRDLSLVGDATRGNYLIRLGGCVTCHTDAANGGGMLAGGPALKTAFGTFYPPNITSDPDVGIGKWTLGQFSRAMSEGESPDGHLYPAFPYDSYTLMSDQEIADLYAALQQVPPSSMTSRPHDLAFPFNVRPLLAAWKNLFFRPRRYADDAMHSEQWNRGRYIVLGPGHCVSCHSPRNALGAIPRGKELGGNPGGGPGGKAPALTSAALTQKQYDVTGLEQVLRDGTTPGFDEVMAPMDEVVRDETSKWTDADRAAVATYLLGAD